MGFDSSLTQKKTLLSRAGDALDRAAARCVYRKNVITHISRPIVTFTFDDAPRSAGHTGGAILEAAGAVGTYYVCGALCGFTDANFLTTNDLRELNARGHEIACHTYSHAKVPGLTHDELRAEIDRNALFVRQCCGDICPSNFSYPYGAVSPGAKALAGTRFTSCRGTSHGINSGTVDLGLLKAVRVYDNRCTSGDIERWFDKLEATNGWLIFYTHDVDDHPSMFGASTRFFESCVLGARRRKLDILTVRDALKAIVPLPSTGRTSGDV